MFKQIKEKVFSYAGDSTQDLETSIPFINELNLSKEDISWIKEIKRSSLRVGTEFTAFRLVKLYLRAQRDLGKLGPHSLSEETEKEIDEVFSFIFSVIPSVLLDEEQRVAMLREPNLADYDRKTIQVIDQYSGNLKAIDKFSLLSRLLDIWHKGGRGIFLDFFSGVPKKKEDNWSEAQSEFFERLNNLGKIK